MSTVITFIPLAIYLLSGIICLAMAFKCFTTGSFLPFHEKAAGVKWGSIDENLKRVILTILRISGSGFLVTAIVLILFPLVNIVKQDAFLDLAVPAIALAFSSCLSLFNYRLSRQTGSETPWKAAVMVTAMLVVAFILSLF